MTVPTFESYLAQWQAKANQLKALKAEEMAMRKALVQAAFPNGTHEGTNVLELADGREFVATVTYRRDVDEAAVPAAREHLAKLNTPDAALVFGVKTTLAVKHLKALEDHDRAIVERALTIKPGSPTVSVR